jgi:hypothetical protein
LTGRLGSGKKRCEKEKRNSQYSHNNSVEDGKVNMLSCI